MQLNRAERQVKRQQGTVWQVVLTTVFPKPAYTRIVKIYSEPLVIKEYVPRIEVPG